MPLDRRANSLGKFIRMICIAIAQHDGDLLAAIAPGMILPDHRLQQLRRLLQHRVSRRMPVRVVDRLELIHVQEEHGNRSARRPRF